MDEALVRSPNADGAMINGPYTDLALFAVVVSGFVLSLILMAIYLGPRRITRTKELPFECGSLPVGDARDQRFNVRFYLVAVLFILFDVEVAFLYPWAVTLPGMGWSAFVAMLGFLLVVFCGFIYAWRRGIFDWNH